MKRPRRPSTSSSSSEGSSTGSSSPVPAEKTSPKKASRQVKRAQKVAESAAAGGRSTSKATSPTSRRTGGAPKITNGDVSKLVRTEEALAMLHLKRTERDIWADVVPFERRTTSEDFDAAHMYKFITWNVAGLRGLLKKNAAALSDFLKSEKPDVLCLQETKLNVDDAAGNAALGIVEGYAFVDHPCAFKRGYSGTRTYLRTTSMVEKLHARCTRGFTLPSPPIAPSAPDVPPVEGDGDVEGRVLSAFLSPNPASATASRIAIVNTYVANSGMGLGRLPYRVQAFDPDMRDYLKRLDAWAGATAAPSKSETASPHGFIWAGDLNVAERDYDRYFAGTYKTMQECSGFAPEERFSFRETMRATVSKDAFRELYPKAGPVYSFWSQRINGRARGLGWRLDYFIVSARLIPYVVDCFPMPTVMGSDHCPFQLWMRHP